MNWIDYTKRKVAIKAILYTNTEAMNEFIIEQSKDSKTPAFVEVETRGCSMIDPEGFDRPILYIRTLEGKMQVQQGDYVVIGTNGEFYPCKPIPFNQVHQVSTPEWIFQKLDETNIVDICDWIHDTDTSSIRGVASSYILSTYQSLGYLAVTQLKSSRVLHAVYGDYVAKSPDGEWHVVTEAVYQYMIA